MKNKENNGVITLMMRMRTTMQMILFNLQLITFILQSYIRNRYLCSILKRLYIQNSWSIHVSQLLLMKCDRLALNYIDNLFIV